MKFKFSTFVMVLVAFAFAALGMSGIAHAVVVAGTDLPETPVVREGESRFIVAPHHASGLAHPPSPHPTGGGGSHYFAETGDEHHFAWFSATPATHGPIVIKYDFRDGPFGPNVITPAERAVAVTALTYWGWATFSKVQFVQDTLAPLDDIINIGSSSGPPFDGPGGILGLGGGFFTHSGAIHGITGGVAFQDSAETWDTTINNGNPAGTFDYYTVVAQEIGHAIGLGHTQNTGQQNMMNGIYTGEQFIMTTIDKFHIRTIYGVGPGGFQPPFSPQALHVLTTNWATLKTERLK